MSMSKGERAEFEELKARLEKIEKFLAAPVYCGPPEVTGPILPGKIVSVAPKRKYTRRSVENAEAQ